MAKNGLQKLRAALVSISRAEVASQEPDHRDNADIDHDGDHDGDHEDDDEDDDADDDTDDDEDDGDDDDDSHHVCLSR